MFKSIVVAFDGSVHASRALEIGATLAGREQIPLGILYAIDASHMKLPDDRRNMAETEHIIEPKPRMVVNFENFPTNLASALAETSSDAEKALFRYGDFLLKQAEDNAREYGAQDIESKAVVGGTAEEVIAFASDRNADLIICGSRGFGKLKRLLLGSTSHQIAQLADCSCLTVR